MWLEFRRVLFRSVSEYIENIKSVTKEQIIEFANGIQMNLIYFLTGNEASKEELEENENFEAEDFEDEDDK